MGRSVRAAACSRSRSSTPVWRSARSTSRSRSVASSRGSPAAMLRRARKPAALPCTPSTSASISTRSLSGERRRRWPLALSRADLLQHPAAEHLVAPDRDPDRAHDREERVPVLLHLLGQPRELGPSRLRRRPGRAAEQLEPSGGAGEVVVEVDRQHRAVLTHGALLSSWRCPARNGVTTSEACGSAVPDHGRDAQRATGRPRRPHHRRGPVGHRRGLAPADVPAAHHAQQRRDRGVRSRAEPTVTLHREEPVNRPGAGSRHARRRATSARP